MAEALYRKYRPQIFEDVVGQEHIERTLKNAIKSDKVSHAYLFTGPRGTGKTTTARLLAKALLCQNGPTPDPDGTCEDCELIANGEHPDVYELDAASRTGVENVREEIIGRVNYAPTRGRNKVYIIDEVHMLSTAAFNALLKTLEEPPDHVVFVLCTTDPQKVPETIHSRCQRFDFRRISNEELVSRLGAICSMEGIEFEGDALDLIAHRAQGGMRDALTSLEQMIAFGEGHVTTELAERLLGSLDFSDLADIVRAIGTRDAAACFRWTSEYMETGADLAQFAQDLAEHMRNMYVMSLAGSDVALEITEAAKRELQVELEWFGPDRLANILGVLGDLLSELKTSTNQRLSFEIALTRMVRPDSDLTLASLADRIEALERGYSSTVRVVPSSSAASAQGASMQNVSSAQDASNAAPAQDASGGSAVQAVSNNSVAQAAPSSSTIQAAPGNPTVQISQGGPVTQTAQSGSAAQVASSSPTAQTASGIPATQTVQGGSAVQSSSAAQVASDSSAVPIEYDAVAAGNNGAVAVGGNLGAANAGNVAVSQAATQATSANTQAAVSSAPVSPSAFPKLWDTALAHLKKTSAAFGVLFMNTRASYDESSSTIAIEFSAGNDFAFQAAHKPEVQKALKDALVKAGIAFPFTMSQSAEPANSPAFTPSVAASSAGVSTIGFGASLESHMGAAAADVGSVSRGASAINDASQNVTQVSPQGETNVAHASDAPWGEPAWEEGPWEEKPSSYQLPDDMPPWEEAPADTSGVPSQTAEPDIPSPDGVNSDSVNVSADDLNNALMAAFGEGVSFEQVE